MIVTHVRTLLVQYANSDCSGENKRQKDGWGKVPRGKGIHSFQYIWCWEKNINNETFRVLQVETSNRNIWSIFKTFTQAPTWHISTQTQSRYAHSLLLSLRPFLSLRLKTSGAAAAWSTVFQARLLMPVESGATRSLPVVNPLKNQTRKIQSPHKLAYHPIFIQV